MIRTLTVLDLADESPMRRAHYDDDSFTAGVEAALNGTRCPEYPLLRDYLLGYLTDPEHGSKCYVPDCRRWTGAGADVDADGRGYGTWAWQTLVTDGTDVWALCEEHSISVTP